MTWQVRYESKWFSDQQPDQIVADFIVEYRINDEHDLEVGYVTCTPWKLFFDGSACDDGQGIGAVLISPSGIFLIFKPVGRRAHE